MYYGAYKPCPCKIVMSSYQRQVDNYVLLIHICDYAFKLFNLTLRWLQHNIYVNRHTKL